MEPPPDHLRAAARIVAVAVLTTGLAVGFLAAFLWLQDPHCRSAARWLRTQRLDGPALMPSGSPVRHPHLAHPGVPLRHDPAIPEFDDRQPGPAEGTGRQS